MNFKTYKMIGQELERIRQLSLQVAKIQHEIDKTVNRLTDYVVEIGGIDEKANE